MRILLTNDDGIFAEGLWALVRVLKDLAQVMVVAPSREQSAIGTAVTLFNPLQVNKVSPLVPDVDAYSVDGTPSDCVILALDKLAGNGIDAVISGINHGANLGDDVLISGTVAAALQGYLRGCHALAVSMERPHNGHLGNGANLAALLVRWMESGNLPDKVFMNVNLPALPMAEISGAMVTRLASGTHTDTAEEGNEGSKRYYRLVRRKKDNAAGEQTDVWAVERGNISLTPLHDDLLNRAVPAIPGDLGSALIQGLREGAVPLGK